MKRLACLVLVLVAAGCGGEEIPAVPEGRYVSVSRSVEPKAAFFGEPVTARVEVVVDTRHLAPERVRVVPRTFPYRPYTELAVDRKDSGRFTRLTFEVGLRCLYYACLPVRADIPGVPYRDQRVTRFQAWQVYYDDPQTKKPRHLARVWWPSLEAVSNLDLTDVRVTFQQSPGRHTPAPLPAVTYRLSPPLTAALLLLAAALLLVYPAVLLRRWQAARRPPPPPPAPPLPPLERALLLVEWARDRVDGEDRRKALEELAFRLDEAGRERQAESARRLAWSAGSPSPEAADALVEEVRRDR